MKLLSLFVFAPIWASAFTLNSQSNPNYKGWSDANIRFALNLTNCPSEVDVRGIINDAFAVWNHIPSSRVKLSLVGETRATTSANPITIVCDTNYGGGNADDMDGSPGMAQVSPEGAVYSTSGIMYLNASSGRANIRNLSRELVAVVLAHEIGHLIGIGHSHDVNALMYYDAGAKTTLSLAQDDIDAATYLYPRDELGKDKIAGCAMITSTTQLPPGFLLFVFLCFALPLLVWLYLRSLFVDQRPCEARQK